MSATGQGKCGIEKQAKVTKSEQDNEHHELRHRRLVKSTPSKPTRIALRGTKATTSPRPAWNSGSPSPTASKAKAPQHTTRTLPRKLPVRAKLPTQEELNHFGQNESRGKDVAVTISGTNVTKEMRCALTVPHILQDGIKEESFDESDLITSPRLKLPVPSQAHIKCDPAIIVCGPRIADREIALRLDTKIPFEVPTDSPENTEIPENKDHFETFRKTLGCLKKVDRNAIRELLQCLKNLDDDEDQTTCSEKASKKASRVPGKVSRKSKVPKAPSTFLSNRQVSHVTSSSSNNGKGSNMPNTFPNNRKESDLSGTFSNNGIMNPLAPSFQIFTHKQEPIWINTFQAPTIIDQEDGAFREFCRANNFIPLVPVPMDSTNSTKLLTKNYVALKPEPISPYSTPLSTIESPVVQSFQLKSQPLKLPGHAVPHLESPLEPAEEDKYREAKALDPAWGSQILKNFVKKYPLTGRVRFEDSTSEHGVAPKAATTIMPKANLKSEGKVTGSKTHNRAAEIQQKLETLLLWQREKHSHLIPEHKLKAAAIQQRLEIMLFMLKEQKALENFSKRVG